MFDHISLTLISILCGVLFYQLVIKYWSYFAKRGLPFIRGLPLLGSNYNVFLGRETIFDAMHRVYGIYTDEPVVGVYDVGGIPQYLVRDPELINRMNVKLFSHFANRRITVDPTVDPLSAGNLLFSKDTTWHEMRSTMSPSFTGSKMRNILPLMNVCGTKLVKHFRTEAANNSDEAIVYEIKDVFTRFAADTIASCAFGLEVNSLTDKDNEFYRTSVSATAVTLLFIPELMRWLKVLYKTAG